MKSTPGIMSIRPSEVQGSEPLRATGDRMGLQNQHGGAKEDLVLKFEPSAVESYQNDPGSFGE